jgi:hypothetical protein
MVPYGAGEMGRGREKEKLKALNYGLVLLFFLFAWAGSDRISAWNK